jgi:uncharacterized protein
MAAPVTHFEIMAKDGQRVRDFYANLFGWAFNEMQGYGMVDTGVKMGINGGIGQLPENMMPSVTFYVQVEDVQAHLDKAVGMGGTVIVPLTEVPGMVTFAQIKDPEGNLIGLLKGPQAPPKPARAKKAAAKKVTAKKKTVRRKPAARKKSKRGSR